MRSRAFINAVRTLRKFEDLPAALADGSLAAVRGIGPGILDVVQRVLNDQPVEALTDLEARIPAGIFEIAKIRGLGPSKVRTLHSELGVTTIAEVAYACNENRLVSLSGFGPATQAKVQGAIEMAARNAGLLRLDQARYLATAEHARLTALDVVKAVQIVGDARRGTETTAGAALLVRVDDADATALTEAVDGVQVEPSEAEGIRRVTYASDNGQVTLGLCPSDDRVGLYALLLTGSDAHLDALRAHATGRGATLGPLGLLVDGTPIPCPDEDAVYTALGLLPTPPERREPGIPLVLVGTAVPTLVCRDDIRGALHNHTTASDGVSTLQAMRDGAAALGLSYLGISDHSQTAGYAGGLEPDRLLTQVASIAKLNAKGAEGTGCTVLSGVESDILGDGSLDYNPAVLAQLDVVIASVHTRHRHDREAATTRMVQAALNPFTDIIGHPTGRLILGRDAVDFDVEAMLQACATHGAAVELNANPQRLDLHEQHLAMAKSLGVMVSIAADAHSVQSLSHLDYGVTIARRAGLGPEDVLNCLPLSGLRAWLQARRTKVGATVDA